MLLSPNPKIRLRLLEEADARAMFSLIDQNRQYLRQWLPWLDTQKTPEDTLHFINGARDQAQRNETLTLGILFEQTLCGVISYHRFDWANRSSMIGYWLAENLQGRGIMTDACRTMLDHGFGRLGLHRIEIRCAAGNKKSCMIPERLGFTREAYVRDAEWLYDHYVDLIVYSMLAPDWKKSHH